MELRKTSVGIVMMAFVALAASGCGQSGSSLIRDVKVKSYQQDGDTFLGMSALLETGAMQLLSIDIPIHDPKNPGELYGHLSARQGFNGASELSVDINLSKAVDLPLVDGNLPNGTPIPVGGLGDTPVIGIPVGGSGARTYVAYGPGVALLGVAVPIKEFDNLGKYVGGLNIFPVFDFGGGVRGIAGIFTGLETKTSGIAVFVDASTALAPKAATEAVALGKSGKKAVRAVVPKSNLLFQEVSPADEQREELNYRLYKMNKKRSTLSIQ